MSFGKSLDGAIDLQVDNLEVYETSDLQGDTRTENQIVLYNSVNDFSLSASQIIQNYSLNLPPTTGTAGQVLATDGTGNLSWFSITGSPGNVSFVGLSVPVPFTVNGASNASITTTGTFMIEFTSTGTGDVVLATSPTLTTPILGDATGTSLQLSSLTASSLLQTDATKNLVSLSNGADGTILTMASGAPTWQVPATSGTVTSVAITVPSILSLTGSPITSSGTFDITTTDTPTGTGSIVLATSPTISSPILTTPNIGAAAGTSLSLTSLTASRLVITDSLQQLSSVSTGTDGQVLTLVSGTPTWTTLASPGTGTVTSVGLTVPSFMSVSGSPITTSGTLAISASSTGTGAVVLQTNPLITDPTITSIKTATSGPFVIRGLPQPNPGDQITPSFADIQIKTTSIVGIDKRDFQILQKGNLYISTGNAKFAVDVYTTTSVPNRTSSFPYNEVTSVGEQSIAPADFLDEGGIVKIRIQNAPTYLTFPIPQVITVSGGGYSGVYTILNADALFIYTTIPFTSPPTGNVTAIIGNTTYNGDLALSAAMNASLTGNKKLTLNTRDVDGEMYLKSNYMVIRTQGDDNRLRFDTREFDAYASGFKFFTPGVTDPLAGGIDSFVAGTIAWNSAGDFEASTGGAADIKAFANAKVWGGGYIDIICRPYNIPLIDYVTSGVSPPRTSGNITLRSEHLTYFTTVIFPNFPIGVFPSNDTIMLTPLPLPIPAGAIVTKVQQGDIDITSNTGGGVNILGQRGGVTIKSKREYNWYSGPKLIFPLPTVYVGVPPALNPGILLDSTEGGAGPIRLRAGNISETEGGVTIEGRVTIDSEDTSIDGIGISLYGASLAIANQTITWTGSNTISTFATAAIQRTTLTRAIAGTTDVNIAAGLVVEDPADGGNLFFTNKYAIYAIGSIFTTSAFLVNTLKIEDSKISVDENLELFTDLPLQNSPLTTPVVAPTVYFGTGTNAVVNVGFGILTFPIGTRIQVLGSAGNTSGSYNGTHTVTGGTFLTISFPSAATGDCTTKGTVSILPITTVERWQFTVPLGSTQFPIGTVLTITDYVTTSGNLNGTFSVVDGNATTVQIDNNAKGLITPGNIRAFFQAPTATTGNGLLATITIPGGTNTYKAGSFVEINYPSTPSFNGIYGVAGSSPVSIQVASTITSFDITDAQVNSIATTPTSVVARSNILFRFTFDCSKVYIPGNRVNLQGFTGVSSSINGVWSIQASTTSTLTVSRAGDTQDVNSMGTVENDFNTIQYFTGATKSAISIGTSKTTGYSIGVDSTNSILSIKKNPTTPLLPASVEIRDILTPSTSTTTGTLVVSGGLGVNGAINSTSLNLSGLTASSAVATDASKNLISVTNTGTGNNVLADSSSLSNISLTGNNIVSGTLSISTSTASPLILESTNIAPLLFFNCPSMTFGSTSTIQFGSDTLTNHAALEYYFSAPGSSSNKLTIGLGSVHRSNFGLEFYHNGVVRFNGLTASSAVATDASKNLISVTNTGTGNNVLKIEPVITNPSFVNTSTSTCCQLVHTSFVTTTFATMFAGNLGNATSAFIYIGKNATSFNNATIFYDHVSDSSTSNSINFGMIGGSSQISINGTQTTIGGTVRLNDLTASRLFWADSSKNLVSLSAGTTGQVLTSQGSSIPTWTTPSAAGVTSVAMTVPSFLSVSGSPITSSGTLAITASRTGTGVVVLNTAPALVAPDIGAATGVSLALVDGLITDTNFNGPNVPITSRNRANTANSYASITVMNSGTAACVWFLNSASRTADGGANTATLRNDAGTLRLQSSSSVGLDISGTTATFTASPLFMTNSLVNKLFVLYDTAFNNHEFYGFGVNPGSLRYQSGGSHTFFVSTSATTSNELFRISQSGSTSRVIASDTANFNLTLTSDSAQARGKIAMPDENHSIFGRVGRDGTTDTMDFYEFGQFRFYTGGAIASQILRLSISNTGVVNISNLTASSIVATDSSKNLISATSTGTGNIVLATSPTISSPTLTTPDIGAATGTSLVTSGAILSDTIVDGANGFVTSRNRSTGGNAFAALRVMNSGAASCILFINSTTRTADGGANTATLRNDAGTLRLLSSSSVGLDIAGTTATVTASTLKVNGMLDQADSNGWAYLGGNSQAAQLNRAGFGFNWNLSGGQGENIMTYYNGAGTVRDFRLASWDGTTRTNRLTITSGGVVNVPNLDQSSVVMTDSSRNLVSRPGFSYQFWNATADTSMPNNTEVLVSNMTKVQGGGSGELVLATGTSAAFRNDNSVPQLFQVTFSARTATEQGPLELRIYANGVLFSAQRNQTNGTVITVSATGRLTTSTTISCWAIQFSGFGQNLTAIRICITTYPIL